MSDSIVLIPTYNERENIAAMVEKVFSLPRAFDLLIIDDNSPDGTAAVVKQLMSEKYAGRLFLEERQGKLGLGTAYIHGFKWALQRSYQYIFEMDADFSHNPDDLPRLYDACASGGADISIGSRYVKGGSVVNWPFDRILLSRCASVYVRMVTWMPVHDTTAGFVCYTRKVLETLNLNKIRSVGYGFQIEMKFAAWRLGFKLAEVPIAFTDRIHGVSKMSTGIFKEAALGVLKMKWQSFFKNYAKTLPPAT
ncbi:polyprenol monophosphomannose synthase [Sphingobacteriales bacterium UPWRP_1]|nr:dolichyl-phosphate beta-D-mannosyltransferase [Sphingobacteriales bacterium TSM_CSM]PSJ75002.1 polyprenol monophosphomannose synthase [Sphingobacteriales bacterium UPWRP_1]